MLWVIATVPLRSRPCRFRLTSALARAQLAEAITSPLQGMLVSDRKSGQRLRDDRLNATGFPVYRQQLERLFSVERLKSVRRVIRAFYRNPVLCACGTQPRSVLRDIMADLPKQVLRGIEGERLRRKRQFNLAHRMAPSVDLTVPPGRDAETTTAAIRVAARPSPDAGLSVTLAGSDAPRCRSRPFACPSRPCW